MEIIKNKIYKLSDIVEDLKKDYLSKLENAGMTEEQVNILFQIACAGTGFWADAIKKGSMADDVAYNVKSNAIKNIVYNVFNLKNIELFDAWEILRAKLKYECVYEFSDESGYLFVHACADEADNLDYVKNGMWYIILEDDGTLDAINYISTDTNAYGMIRIMAEHAAENKELLSKIDELGLDTSYYFR